MEDNTLDMDERRLIELYPLPPYVGPFRGSSSTNEGCEHPFAYSHDGATTAEQTRPCSKCDFLTAYFSLEKCLIYSLRIHLENGVVLRHSCQMYEVQKDFPRP